MEGAPWGWPIGQNQGQWAGLGKIRTEKGWNQDQKGRGQREGLGFGCGWLGALWKGSWVAGVSGVIMGCQSCGLL